MRAKLYVIAGMAISLLTFWRTASRKTSTADTTQPDSTQQYADALYPVNNDGAWGYFNRDLKMVIAPRFTSADDFSEGLAIVSSSKDGEADKGRELFGCIDKTGRQIVPFKYDKMLAFTQGMAVIVKDGKYGFVNASGFQVIAPQFEEAGSFANGLAPVKVQGKTGFVNKSGTMVIAPKFSRACWVSQFAEGLAAVYLPDETGGYIDVRGKMVIANSYTYVSAFSEGLALVQPKGSHKYGYINRQGEMVIPARYDLSLPFCEGVATVKVSRKDGTSYFQIIDKGGNVIADKLLYAFTGIFREGLAGVESLNHRWGFIDKTGKEVIPPKFASVRLFNNGLAMIQTGSLFTQLKPGYIDKSGKIVVDTQSELITLIPSN